MSDSNTIQKPPHSKIDRFCPNKGIARIATKSGSDQDSKAVLVAPIVRELSKKIT